MNDTKAICTTYLIQSNRTEERAMAEQSKTTLISVPFKGTEEKALILTKKKNRFFCHMCSASKFRSYEGLAEGSLILHARLKHSLKLTWNKKHKCAERLESWRSIPTCPHCSKEYRRALSESDLAYQKHVGKCAQGTKRKAVKEKEEDRLRQTLSDHNYGNPNSFTTAISEKINVQLKETTRMGHPPAEQALKF